MIVCRGNVMTEANKAHWPEYLIEAWGLGTFMVSACTFGVLLFHPDSYFAGYSISVRNVMMGLAMGLTAIGIFTSPWGKRSGSHINPVVTLTFYRLGKIKPFDAFFYIVAQFLGGILGVLASWVLLGNRLSAPEVSFVPTIPGTYGQTAAFVGELVIAYFMMTMVLVTSNDRRLYRFTPFIAGLMVAAYIAIESPISGMSMNPARTLGSAVVGNVWTGWWIYFTAPPIAMLAAAEVYVRMSGIRSVLCAKFDHNSNARCIFDCRFDQLHKPEQEGGDSPVPENALPACERIVVIDHPQAFRTSAGIF